MSHFRGVAAVLVLALSAAFGALRGWHPARPPRAVGLPTAAVPVVIAGFRSDGDRPPTDFIQKALPGATIIDRSYHQGAASLDFLLISGAHGVALHDPRLCLGGWLLAAPQTERLAGTPVTMQVYHASTHAGAAPDLVVAYFYAANGRIISNPSQIRSALIWGDLLGRQDAPVFFFRFVQPLAPDPEAARLQHQQLQAFAADTWLALRPKIEGVTHENFSDGG